MFLLKGEADGTVVPEAAAHADTVLTGTAARADTAVPQTAVQADTALPLADVERARQKLVTCKYLTII